MDNRPEGVYVSETTVVYDIKLYLIERVNGNATVSSVEITQREAENMMSQLEAFKVFSKITKLRSAIINEDYVERLR